MHEQSRLWERTKPFFVGFAMICMVAASAWVLLARPQIESALAPGGMIAGAETLLAALVFSAFGERTSWAASCFALASVVAIGMSALGIAVS